MISQRLWRRSVLCLAAFSTLCVSMMCCTAQAAIVNLSTSHDYTAPANITASASSQLTGLASLAQMQATTQANRYVYSFETWPETTTSLGANTYTFQFDLNGDGTADQQVTASYTGSYSSTTNLSKATNAAASSPTTWLAGLGDIGWGGSTYSDHTFKFQKPVSACGVVYRSASTMYLKKTAGGSNNFPVSYTLSDGTVINLGTSGVAGATITVATNTFVGVIDTTGKGIVSISFRVQGSVGSASQQCNIDDQAFVEIPEVTQAAVANLRARHDFANPAGITASASTSLAGLCSLADFRDLAGYNRHVYSFTTWPQAAASLGANNFPFKFDLNGDGTEDQRITIAYSGSYSGSTQLTKGTNASSSSPSTCLAGLGDIGWSGSTHASHTFTFQKPVSAFGFTYRSASNMYLRKQVFNANNFPVSYTLTDGTVVNLGTSGVSGATIAANTNTFVGVIDDSGKGIASFTARVQGTASSSQQCTIDDVAFVLAGPPPGTWTLVLDDQFTGTSLNTAVWSKGYRFHDIINEELQGYVPENVSVANGLCTIKIEKRQCRSTDMYGVQDDVVQNYASGAIQTYEKWAQAYGYFEARIKMPNAPGTWPAFWMTPDRGPSYSLPNRVALGNGGGTMAMGNELDITEFMSAWKNSTTGLFTSHAGYFWNYSGGSKSDWSRTNDGYGPSQFYYPAADTKFHTYGMYWAPGKLVFYIDGKVVNRFNDATFIGSAPGNLILNCAISTNFWVRTGTISEIDAGLATPKYMDIDYVKVWTGTAE